MFEVCKKTARSPLTELNICCIITAIIWIVSAFAGGALYNSSDIQGRQFNVGVSIQAPNLQQNETSFTNEAELFKDIVTNNIYCNINNLKGAALFGLPTVINVTLNGLVHGNQLAQIIHQPYTETGTLRIKRILPHSFELIGLFMSGGVAFNGVWILIGIIRSRSDKFWYSIIISIAYILISISITYLAALIEAYYSTSL